MKTKELNEIISSMDLNAIQKSLEILGYRNASKNGVWEFDPVSIANANIVENSERYEDVFDDKIYVGDIHADIKEYPNLEFIVITVNKVYRNKNNLEQPIEMLLFTKAPINEEYEREQNKICRCNNCKKEFPTSELCEVNGKLICDDCFEKDLKRLKLNGKSKFATKIKK